MIDIAQNIRKIRARIANTALACGRSPESITLLAITKTFPVETISRAIEAGQRHFGENRVQEAEPKILALASRAHLEWHMVGHLQSNKARRAAEVFDVIHSVDSIKLAEKLGQTSVTLGKQLSVLLQVDLGHEPTKFGIDPKEIREILAAILNLKGIRVNGLMIIPPFFENPEQARPCFAQLRDLRDALESEQPACLGQQQLSMGMSHDFEVAIQEGSTLVRIGTAIFGERSHG